MNTQLMRRGHRKRLSALRLSSDSTITALPVYTSPSWQRPIVLVDDPSDLPPEYPDSAEEADEDTDTEEDEECQILYAAHPPSAPLTSPPRRARRLQTTSRSKSRRSASSEPYLDSLLARSVHALEMSNALLQSSMSTQATLNNVLSRDSQDEASLEVHARNLSSRITRDDNWFADLDEISQGVETLFEEEGESSRRQVSEDSTTSQSLPASSPLSTVAERMSRSHRRRPSLDLRNASLNLSAHGRNDLIAPPPRAITMYVDSSEDPSSITLPPTLGLRSSSRPAATPLPAESSFTSRRPLLLHAVGSESDLPKRSAMDVLSSVTSPPKHISATTSSSPSSSLLTRRGSTSTSTSTATRRPRHSRSPQAGPSSRSPTSSPSRDSANRSPCSARRIWDTPPIIELPSASSSESSDDLHVEQTVSRLRNILENHQASPAALEKQKQKEAAMPSFLKPPPVAPVADASTATASVSRLLTKARHTSSTRPPSPPRHSALKGRSGRSAPPTPTSPTPSLSSSWQSVSDAIRIGSSGRSTPNRVSFIEPPDAKQGPGGKDKSSLRTRSRSRSKGKGKAKAGDGESNDSPSGWWSWLIGPAPSSSSVVPPYVRQEERLVRGAGWAPRAGFGGSIEEWGV